MTVIPRFSAAFLLCAALVQMSAARPAAAPAQQQPQNAPATAQPQGSAPQGAAPRGGAAQGNPPQGDGQQQQPIFRGGINYVRVDVIVTDRKAQPVTDLKQADFEVLEDNKPQAIESFTLVKVDGNPKPGDPPPREIRGRDDEEAEAQKEDVRIFAILLDDYHVRQGNSISVREPLTRFIQTQLRPNDMVAVMYPLTPVDGISFTRNHGQVVNAINRFEGRKFDYRPRNQFEETYARYPTETVEKIRNDISMGALRALAVRLGALREGRKSIIYVSEGFTAQLPPQMRRADASAPQPVMPGAGALEGSPREQTGEWFSQSDIYSRLRDVFADANRNNASIYSLDPRGLAVFEYDINDGAIGAGPPGFQTDRRALQMTQDTLRTLAEETDGRAIVNRNTLLEGLNQIARDSSFYYLLGYNSSQAPTDGKFHEIKVRVKRQNVDVRARRGYWAATVEDTIRAANPTPEIAKPIQQALATIAPSVLSGKYVRTWIGTERSEGGKTRVTLVWEPLPPVPGTTRRDSPGRVAVLAATEKGDLVFRGRSPDAALASSRPATAPNDAGPASPRTPAAPAATAPQRLVFDAPPGKVELRLTIEGAGGSGTLDNEVRTIDVPDLTAPQAALSTPRVYRSRNAREFQAVSADVNAVPVPARDFSRTERLLIRFDVYGPGNEQPQATAAILNRTGAKMSDVTVAPAPAGGTHQIDLPLNTLTAGDYLLEVTIKGTTGEAKELVPFRVGT
jgi:VWFA-related protein